MTPLEALRALFAAWEAGDADALAPLFCPDGAYLDPLKPGPLEGVEAIVAGNRPAMAAIEDCRITVGLELQEGERAIVEGFFASRLADGGARFDFPFVAVAELREGRIARLAEYFDTRPLLAEG
jgi:ketosteroid isomerase-like protein